MRPDLNKLLCERERFGSEKSFRTKRRIKKFAQKTDEEYSNLRSHESMTLRYGGGSKQFSENLNPLEGQVRKNVGRPWNKFYSELSRNFDKRSVINQHILQHLYDYIAKDVVAGDDGSLQIVEGYGDAYIPLVGSSFEYYVDPRDGLIKKNKMTNKVIRKIKNEKKPKEPETVIWMNKDNVLRLLDGIWYHFTVKDIPISEAPYYEEPPENNLYPNRLYLNRFGKLSLWDKLNDNEKAKYGVCRQNHIIVYDVFEHKNVYRDEIPKPRGFFERDVTRYHATKKTASKKQLRDAGITSVEEVKSKSLTRRDMNRIQKI